MSASEHRRNQDIRSPQLRVIDHDGEMRGILSRQEAIELAQGLDLDLVEIQPQSDPPVCRIMDYGKFRYEQQKKAAVARRHQKQIETKEIQFRPTICDHDYQTKVTHVRAFLDEGNKVRLVVRMKGRERNNPELGQRLMARLTEDLAHDAQFDPRAAVSSDAQILAVVAPLPKKGHAPKP